MRILMPQMVWRICSGGTPRSRSTMRLSLPQTIGAPVRMAISAASPRWSTGGWLTRMTSGVSRSSGPQGAVRLPVRKGSMRMRCLGPTIS